MVYSSAGLPGDEHCACCVVGVAMRFHLLSGVVAYSAWYGAGRVGGGDYWECGTGVGC